MKKITTLLLLATTFLSNAQSKTDDVLQSYYNAGMPTLNKDWSPEEFVNTIDIIVTAANEETLPLPNSTDASKAIISKLTDYTNYWFFTSDAVSENEKIFADLNILNGISQLVVVYHQAGSNSDQVLNYSNEAMLMMCTMMKLMGTEMGLAQNFMTTHPDLNDVQKEGIRKMKMGLNTTISGMLTVIQTDYVQYNESDVCFLANVFFDFYKEQRDRIDEVSRNEFDKKRDDISKNHKYDCVRRSATM